MFTPDQLAKFKTFSQSLKGTVADPHRRRPPGAFDGKPKLKARDGVAGYKNSRLSHDDNDNADPQLMEKVKAFLEKNGVRDQGVVKVMQVLSQELPSSKVATGLDDEPEGETYEEGEEPVGIDETDAEAQEDLRQQNREPVQEQLTAASQFKNAPLQQNIGKSLEDMPKGRDGRGMGRFGGRAKDQPPRFDGEPLVGGGQVPLDKRQVSGDAARFASRYPDSRLIGSAPPPRTRKVIAQRKERARAFLAMDGNDRSSFAARYPNASRIKVI
jgi:hypothetical protein